MDPKSVNFTVARNLSPKKKASELINSLYELTQNKSKKLMLTYQKLRKKHTSQSELGKVLTETT